MGRKRKGRPVHGWLTLDKPPGMTSTQALSRVRQLFGAEKAGHGGTLDPIATGVLPIAFGEATKTVAWAMEGEKVYRFTLRFGEQRTTDDCEGEVTATSDVRPTMEAIAAVLPAFMGEIEQTPPQFSAIKINGERAYDLARDGEQVPLEPRLVRVDRLSLTQRIDDDSVEIEAVCGKGVYMRSLARDIAAALGSCGHVAALRRFSVGQFTLDVAISLDRLVEIAQTPELDKLLLPIETALDDIPALALTEDEAGRLRMGQSLMMIRRQDVNRLPILPLPDGVDEDDPEIGAAAPIVLASCRGRPVALVQIDGVAVYPVRVLNL
ncbi:tRNA pseudouridine synthase B [Azospirillaceae bacterium]